MAELVTLDPARLGGICDTVPFDKRMALIPDLFGQLDVAIGQAGFFYVGPQTALYRTVGDRMEVRIGVPLDKPVPGFEMFECPGGPALRQTLRGGFDGLPGVYQTLNSEVAKRGLLRGTWAREVYRQVAKDATLNVVDVYMDVNAA